MWKSLGAKVEFDWMQALKVCFYFLKIILNYFRNHLLSIDYKKKSGLSFFKENPLKNGHSCVRLKTILFDWFSISFRFYASKPMQYCLHNLLSIQYCYLYDSRPCIWPTSSLLLCFPSLYHNTYALYKEHFYSTPLLLLTHP